MNKQVRNFLYSSTVQLLPTHDTRLFDRQKINKWRNSPGARVKAIRNLELNHSIGPGSFFQKAPILAPQKNESLNQKMHLKMPLSSHGLKLLNTKPGCWVSALSLLCDLDTTTYCFLTSSSFRWVLFFQFLMPEITLVSMLESEWRVWDCHATCRYQKTTIFDCIACGWA